MNFLFVFVLLIILSILLHGIVEAILLKKIEMNRISQFCLSVSFAVEIFLAISLVGFIFSPKKYDDVYTVKSIQVENKDIIVVDGEEISLNEQFGLDFEDGEDIEVKKVSSGPYFFWVFSPFDSHYEYKYVGKNNQVYEAFTLGG